MIDPTTEFGARVARRLETELIIWLTTVRSDGIPQPSPVWFYWDGTSLLIYSQPGKQKLRNIAGSAKVALHLNSDAEGHDVVILSGEAHIDEQAPAILDLAPYVQKYEGQITSMGTTVERFAQEYSVAIRVRPTKLRGF